MAALRLAAFASLLPASARAADAGDAAATTSLQRIAGGAGIAAGAPDGSGVDVAIIDSGVMPIGPPAGRVVHGPDFSAERRDRRLATLDTLRPRHARRRRDRRPDPRSGRLPASSP